MFFLSCCNHVLTVCCDCSVNVYRVDPCGLTVASNTAVNQRTNSKALSEVLALNLSNAIAALRSSVNAAMVRPTMIGTGMSRCRANR